jgi:hypothetical protein
VEYDSKNKRVWSGSIRGRIQSVEGRDLETHKFPGFGHLGVYPALINAKEVDLDEARLASMQN